MNTGFFSVRAQNRELANREDIVTEFHKKVHCIRRTADSTFKNFEIFFLKYANSDTFPELV